MKSGSKHLTLRPLASWLVLAFGGWAVYGGEPASDKSPESPSHLKLIQVTAGCLLVVASSGCAAIGTRENDGAGHYFAGVRDDAYYLAHPSEADYPELQPLNILDLPFSFTVDLVCWPYDFDVNHTKHTGPAPADRFF